MTIPDYQTLMLHLLELLSDGKERSIRECTDTLANQFGLTQEARVQLLPSGQQPVFNNRVGWARTYLKKAGLLESPTRGVVRITQRGKEVLKEAPPKIDNAFLMQFQEFRDFRDRSPEGKTRTLEGNQEEVKEDPVERIDFAFADFQEALIEELLEQLRDIPPAFFERLVVQLLVKMGYGGGMTQAAKVIGRSGDEGIDGVINEDKLGLDVIYIQAKQWANPVGRPEVQKFVGALHGKRAKKGVFMTTSTFTKEARDFVEHLEPRVVLIDGESIARMMIDHNVGVTTKAKYELKSVDRDFFSELI
ncbi:MAG: Mrr restriction system protein [Synergistales bacterium 53_16]|nr:MAG: Mrr restriction system protein [Synergistales bacterium 53_16]